MPDIAFTHCWTFDRFVLHTDYHRLLRFGYGWTFDSVALPEHLFPVATVCCTLPCLYTFFYPTLPHTAYVTFPTHLHCPTVPAFTPPLDHTLPPHVCCSLLDGRYPVVYYTLRFIAALPGLVYS